MKRPRFFLFVLAALLLFSLPAQAEWQPEPDLQAAAYYLVNLDTDTVVAQKNAHEVRSPASLTKMMTCLLLVESGADLNESITIPERLRDEFALIQVENGSDADLKIGETITLENLLYCALLPSANDAASVIGDYLSGGDLDAFVRRMNTRAQQLGCTDTAFNCTHGLYEDIGPGNWSTAYDMALLARACAQNPTLMRVAETAPIYWLPLSNKHTAPRTYTDDAQVPGGLVPPGMSYYIRSTNVMQWPGDAVYRPYIHGLKTGFTDLAGKCFATVARQDNEEYLLVMLGEPNLYTDGNAQVYLDTAALLDWTLARFEPGDAARSGTAIASLPLANCAQTDLAALRAGQSLPALLDTRADLTYTVVSEEDTLRAPLKDGQTVGSVEIRQDGQLLGTVPLLVDGDYRYSLLTQISSALKSLFK